MISLVLCLLTVNFDGSWYTVENSVYKQNPTNILASFPTKESGLTLRMKSPLKVSGKLRIHLRTVQSTKQLFFVKFWGPKGAYEAEYIPVDTDTSSILVNLDGVQDEVGDIQIIKIWSLNPADNILFDSYEIEKGLIEVPDYVNPSFSKSIVENGDFNFGLMGWEFWAFNGTYRQNVKDGWAEITYTGQNEPKTEAALFSQYFNLGQGEYTLHMLLDGEGVADWSIKWDDPNGVSKISGGFYAEPFQLNGRTKIVSKFTIKQTLKCRLYVVSRSPQDLRIDNVRIQPQKGRLRIVGNKVHIDNKEEFVIGYYAKNPDHLQSFPFKHVQPDGIPPIQYLDSCYKTGVRVWPEISGMVRARSVDRLSQVESLWKLHPAVVGLYTDEPDHLETGVRPEEMEYVRSECPLPSMAALMSWNKSAHYEYNQSADILGIELYPIITNKSVDWCEQVLKRAIKASRGKPIFTVIEASPKLSVEDQTRLLNLGKINGVAGTFVWNEGIEKDTTKLEAFRLAVQKLGE